MMHIMRLAFVPLLSVGIVFGLSAGTLHAPGAVVRSLPIATGIPSVDLFSWNKTIALQRKILYGQPAQKPLNGCPEMFSGPILDCSVCGGEDPNTPGVCSQQTSSGAWRCACNPATSPSVTTTVVLATNGTDTATGTYELETLTQYASLREHITMMTTTSVTATSSSGDSLETVAAVVLAGGLVWFLADYVGAANAVAQLKPPEPNNVKTCPNPKDKCADCGGTIGMCLNGSNPGCGCDEKTCPADGADDQPACADEAACAGSDGQCTTGDNEGCKCSEPAECPGLDIGNGAIFWCMFCGGADANGKCIGDPEEDPPNLWKGCDCWPDPDWSLHTPGQKRKPKRDTGGLTIDNWPEIVYPEPSPVSSSAIPSSTAMPNAQCTSTDFSIIPYNVFLPGVYTDYCNTLNAADKTQAFTQTVNSTGAIITASTRKRNIVDRTPPPNPSTYSSFKFDLSWTGGDGSCSSGCTDAFYNIAQSVCGHSGGESNFMTNSATLDTGCGVYSYKITNTDASAGPATVLPTVGDHNLCNNPSLTFNLPFTLNWAEDAVSQFCASDIGLPSGSIPVTHTYEYENVDVRTSVGWSYDGQTGCGKITNADGSLESTVTASECSQYLLSAVNNCNPDTTKDKFGGTFTWSSPIGCIAFGVSGIAGGAGLG